MDIQTRLGIGALAVLALALFAGYADQGSSTPNYYGSGFGNLVAAIALMAGVAGLIYMLAPLAKSLREQSKKW